MNQAGGAGAACVLQGKLTLFQHLWVISSPFKLILYTMVCSIDLSTCFVQRYLLPILKLMVTLYDNTVRRETDERNPKQPSSKTSTHIYAWVFHLVTEQMKNMGDNSSLSLKQLSIKLATLFAITCPKRVSSLSSLDLHHYKLLWEGLVFISYSYTNYSQRITHTGIIPRGTVSDLMAYLCLCVCTCHPVSAML